MWQLFILRLNILFTARYNMVSAICTVNTGALFNCRTSYLPDGAANTICV